MLSKNSNHCSDLRLWLTSETLQWLLHFLVRWPQGELRCIVANAKQLVAPWAILWVLGKSSIGTRWLAQTISGTFARMLRTLMHQKPSPISIMFCRSILEGSHGQTLEIMLLISRGSWSHGAMAHPLIAYRALAPRMRHTMRIYRMEEVVLISTLVCAPSRNYRSIIYWLLSEACLEFGAYQVAPETGPSLISRVLQADYT